MAGKIKVSKKIVEEILESKGIKYSDWLAEKHLEVLNENEEILSEKFKKAKQYDELNK
ncbi:hypothetical protein NSA50_16805 [Clostridium sp. DSM 100503]|uniref:hypothetical protein n=1 Tax=Clostridium sp. DSM 100503 TaxID=2963282 RepID=UPI002149E2AD|nr:hypothetical protein [Clostridium sp. DSM 100503]MCR1952687.1 hypothetical protein [Clostridium sp. DSM 100503]